MSISLKIDGVAKVNKFLKSKNKEAIALIKAAMNKVELFMVNEVKQSIAGRKAEPRSVDTGEFLKRIDSTSAANYAKVSSPLDYAKHLEEGTSKIAPRKHFRNSLNRNKDKINAYINTELKKLS